jgi:hypothetical protein
MINEYKEENTDNAQGYAHDQSERGDQYLMRGAYPGAEEARTLSGVWLRDWSAVGSSVSTHGRKKERD